MNRENQALMKGGHAGKFRKCPKKNQMTVRAFFLALAPPARISLQKSKQFNQCAQSEFIVRNVEIPRRMPFADTRERIVHRTTAGQNQPSNLPFVFVGFEASVMQPRCVQNADDNQEPRLFGHEPRHLAGRATS